MIRQTALTVEVPRALKPLLAPARYKGAYGGRGGAKSHFFAEQLVLRCLRQRTRAVCLREVQRDLKDSVRQLIVDKIDKFGVRHLFEITQGEIRGPHDSLIIFRGMQHYNAESIKSLEDFDIAWVEEAQTFSDTSLTMLRPTIRKEDSELWFSWNPRHKNDAVDKLLRRDKPEGAIVVNVNWRDNPWFPAVLHDEMVHDQLTNPERAAHVWEGQYAIIVEGSYYGKDVALAEREGRVTRVPHDRAADTYASWDLGVGPNLAVWVFQRVQLEWHWLRYFEAERGQVGALDQAVDWIKQLPFVVHEHFLPHDSQAEARQSGRTDVQFLEARNLKCTVIERHSPDDRIRMAQRDFTKFWFDREGCSEGLESLRMYHSEFDEKAQVLKLRPAHDWASHGADAFGYGVYAAPVKTAEHLPQVETDWVR